MAKAIDHQKNSHHHPTTPADVAMLVQLGMDGVFVGSGIFKSSNPERRARAMVQAVTHYNDPKLLAEVSEDLGAPMVRSDHCHLTSTHYTQSNLV